MTKYVMYGGFAFNLAVVKKMTSIVSDKKTMEQKMEIVYENLCNSKKITLEEFTDFCIIYSGHGALNLIRHLDKTGLLSSDLLIKGLRSYNDHDYSQYPEISRVMVCFDKVLFWVAPVQVLNFLSCCGASFTVSQTPYGFEISKKILKARNVDPNGKAWNFISFPLKKPGKVVRPRGMAVDKRLIHCFDTEDRRIMVSSNYEEAREKNYTDEELQLDWSLLKQTKKTDHTPLPIDTYLSTYKDGTTLFAGCSKPFNFDMTKIKKPILAIMANRSSGHQTYSNLLSFLEKGWLPLSKNQMPNPSHGYNKRHVHLLFPIIYVGNSQIAEKHNIDVGRLLKNIPFKYRKISPLYKKED